MKIWGWSKAGAVALALGLGIVLSACDGGSGTSGEAVQVDEAARQAQSEKLATFFEAAFDEHLNRSPMQKSFYGIKDDNDKWDDLSDAFATEELEITKRQLGELQAFDFDLMSEQEQLSYRLFELQAERAIRNFEFRNHSYPVNQMRGWHTLIPTFLANMHRVDNESDAEAYIARLNGVQGLMEQVLTNLRTRQDMGIVPPKFVFPLVIDASRNVIDGAPFGDGEDSPIMADFRKKVAELDISEDQKAALLARASEALTSSVGPAYEALIAFLEAQEEIATADDGVWKFPDGEAFYALRLENYTTTDLSADEIHQLGLTHVARIHGEMEAIKEAVGFEGTLQEFFVFMREDPQFYYADSDEGRAAYLARATDIIDTMKATIPEYFGVLPEADLVVRRVEEFRENSAGKAFYQRPALDGSRPGTYYANLKEMADMPKYQMEALAYHEGIPGHHLQIAISQELTGVPRFQKLTGFTAYSEGWGLYSEELAKDMGFYGDPYSDFGRLAMELWRACRLVVDTGIHSKKWTRQQAIDYLVQNTPNAETDATTAINRYIVMPGQATAYMIGKLKIKELREFARAELGEGFSMSGYHDEVLRHGPVPLNILEENINAWVTAKQGS